MSSLPLETAKDLKKVILPSKVHCLMRHNFKNVFCFDNMQARRNEKNYAGGLEVYQKMLANLVSCLRRLFH